MVQLNFVKMFEDIDNLENRQKLLEKYFLLSEAGRKEFEEFIAYPRVKEQLEILDNNKKSDAYSDVIDEISKKNIKSPSTAVEISAAIDRAALEIRKQVARARDSQVRK